MSNIYVHPSLVRFTKDSVCEFRLPELSLSELLSSIITLHPSLKAVLIDEEGNLSTFVNIYVNGENYRHLPSNTRLNANDQVELMTPLVGG